MNKAKQLIKNKLRKFSINTLVGLSIFGLILSSVLSTPMTVFAQPANTYSASPITQGYDAAVTQQTWTYQGADGQLNNSTDGGSFSASPIINGYEAQTQQTLFGSQPVDSSSLVPVSGGEYKAPTVKEYKGGFSYTDENGATRYVGKTPDGQLVNSEGTGPATGVSAGGTASGAFQCSAAGLIGNLLATSIKSAITNLIGSALKNAVGAVLGGPVPVDVKGQVADHIVGDTQARSGSFTKASILKGISWDGVAWCIVNSMIEQIANATIAWANSGFNGNPAFIQNPERFFSDLADQTAGSIIKDIAYGATGVNVCKPFRVNVAVNLSQSYQGTGANQTQSQLRGLSCRLSDITSQRFFGGITTSVGTSRVSNKNRGNINWNDWIEVTQNDQSNPYGAYIVANQVLHAGVSNRNNVVQFEVGLNNGWLNFKKCKDPKNPKSCDIVTPGRLIESQLNSTLDQSKQRLVMAQKFDQMITAIVNNLIKVALNKVLSR